MVNQSHQLLFQVEKRENQQRPVQVLNPVNFYHQKSPDCLSLITSSLQYGPSSWNVVKTWNVVTPCETCENEQIPLLNFSSI
mmetsp:Transcript_122491/g.222727  ORF Transcript_122491/g.222727 Transcript_122491/m.222727 type:complete len:82 (+) Transcript_122491:144-389(+)